MTEVSSRRPQGNNNEKHDWVGEREQDLIEAISLLISVEETRDFLREVFTLEEIENAAKRWCAARKLFEGIAHVDVVDQCGVNKNTVSRANRVFIRFGNGVSEVIYQRLKEYKERVN